MRSTLVEHGELAVERARFAAGERQKRHTDRYSRITLVLRGRFREESQRGEEVVKPGDVLFKSRRAPHEDYFGDEGAELVSLVFRTDADDAFDAAGASDAWRVSRDSHDLRHAFALLEAACENDAAGVAVAGADLIERLQENGPPAADPPAWLLSLKDDLTQASLAAVKVEARAREAGVHPVYVSRLFRRCFRVSITEHAQTASVRRALTMLPAPEARLSEIAVAAGFYDQSHMNRVFRRVTGRTPGAHRALLGRAAG